MKEIGAELEQAREAMGVTIEEAASDLKLKPSQLENVEKGNRSVFKDVFELKQIIKDYAKYLSLEYEKLEDEFNEFVFEYTSKIPLDEIAKANEEKKLEKKEIISPYTIEYKRRLPFKTFLLSALIIIVLSIITYVVVNQIKENTSANTSDLTYYIKGEWKYEFSK